MYYSLTQFFFIIEKYVNCVSILYYVQLHIFSNHVYCTLHKLKYIYLGFLNFYFVHNRNIIITSDIARFSMAQN